MEKSQEKLKKLASKLPSTPGVYKFLNAKKEIIYIGKATSLKARVNSYFTKDLSEKRSPLIFKMMLEAKKVVCEPTNSVLEALILESALIKRYLPPYNTADKDQKSWNYVVITDEDFPRVLIVRERELNLDSRFKILDSSFGPFTNSGQLREAMKIVRKIFPFRDRCNPPKTGTIDGKGCFNYQIGLCPGVCAGVVSKKEYRKTIKHIKTFFEGKTKKLISDLEKEMKVEAKNREFEKADEIKRKVFALQHIHDIALIKNDYSDPQSSSSKLIASFRIESYDVAHISNTNRVGVMTVMENGEINKNEYRMFKIKGKDSGGDTGALREILERRFKHNEWRLPQLVVVDGAEAQLSTTQKVLDNFGLKIPLVSVVKDEKHKPKEIRSQNPESGILAKKHEKEILLANNESHRFAIKFHRKLRERLF